MPYERGLAHLELVLWAGATLFVASVAGYIVLDSTRAKSSSTGLSPAQTRYVESVATQQAETYINALATQQVDQRVRAAAPQPATTTPRPISDPRISTASPTPPPTSLAPLPASVVEPPQPTPSSAPATPPADPPTATPRPQPSPIAFSARYLDHIQCRGGGSYLDCSGNSRGIDVHFTCDAYSNGDLQCAGTTASGQSVEFFCTPDPNWRGREYEHWYCS